MRARAVDSLLASCCIALLACGRPSRAQQPPADAPAKPAAALRICGDPGNMPLSNDKGEGFENKIAEVLAAQMGTKVGYFWRPYFERGLTRQTFDTNDCDVLMDMPADYDALLTTIPIYRTTYVFAYRDDRGFDFESLDDPALKKLKVGVFETSAAREALANHGVKNNVAVHVLSHDADLVPEHQPWMQVQQVVDGTLDVAAVWGPFAGWLKTMRNAPLVIQPINLMDDDVKMQFELAIGTRKSDVALKRALDDALRARRDEIRRILDDYGVPLVQCGECLISGDIPPHGSYTAKATRVEQREERVTRISTAQVERWLAAGADVDQELADAVLSNDAERAAFLLDKGADVNRLDAQGSAPLHTAARGGSTRMIGLLLDRKADPNRRDGDGWTPLLHAVMRGRAEAAKLLVQRGAAIETPTPSGYTPLALAIEERRFEVARVLLDLGANVNTPGGPQKITPLMIASSLAAPKGDDDGARATPADIARALIRRGANVDARTSLGVTPLMIAAARDNLPIVDVLVASGPDLAAKSNEGRTALEIARQNGSESAAKRISQALRSTDG